MDYQTKQAPTGFSNGGYASPSATQITGIAPLDELSKSLAGIYDRTVSAINAVRTTADALFGSEPPSEKAVGGNGIARPGRLYGLNDQASLVHQAFIELEHQISRLATVN